MAHIGFDALKQQLARRAGVTDPAALAAAIGDRKYGKAAMSKAAATRHPLAGKPKRSNPARDRALAMFAGRPAASRSRGGGRSAENDPRYPRRHG